MKRAALPIMGIIVMVVIAKTVNPIVAVGGIILAGMIGMGIGVALNSLIFKEKKTAKQTEE